MITSLLFAGVLAASSPVLAENPVLPSAVETAGTSAHCLGPAGWLPGTLQIEPEPPVTEAKPPQAGDCALV